MDALVSEVAVPVSPLPMPVVVKSLSGNRQDRCRARPQVIVDVLGWFVGSFWADGTTGFVAQTSRDLNVTNSARMNEGHGVSHPRVGSALRAGLDNSIVLACCLNKSATFENVVRNRFFDIDVFARLNRPNGSQGMPVVRCGDADSIDRFVVEESSEILDPTWLLSVL